MSDEDDRDEVVNGDLYEDEESWDNEDDLWAAFDDLFGTSCSEED